MKAEEIKKFINNSDCGPDADIAALQQQLVDELAAEVSDFTEALEVLGEMSTEINERLAQVEDEDRIAQLESKLKLVEGAQAELEQRAAAAPARARSVLIVDDSEERLEEIKSSVPVSIDAEEERQLSEQQKSKKEKKPKAGKEKADDSSKKAEREAEKLIKELKKEEKAKAASNVNDGGAQQTATGSDGSAAASSGTGANASNQTGTSDGTASDSNSASKMDEDLANALKAYYEGHIGKARDELKNVANKKGMTRENSGAAKFLYGQMLEKGEGGPSDHDAAMFWIEAAAREKNTESLLWLGRYYAELTPPNEELKAEYADKSLKYFIQADKSVPTGSDVAKEKYIDVCENRPVRHSAVKLACKYCDILRDKQTDAYESSQYDRKKEAIRNNYNTVGKKAKHSQNTMICGFRDVLVLLGSVGVLDADFRITMSMLGKGNALTKLPGIDNLAELIGYSFSDSEHIGYDGSSLLVNANFDWDYTFYFPLTLLAGMLLFFIGRVLMGLERYNSRGRLTELFCEAASVVTWLTVFGNVALRISKNAYGGPFFGACLAASTMIVLTTAAALISKPFRN